MLRDVAGVIGPEGGPTMPDDRQKTSRCATCPLRRKAEAKPQSLLARLWRWHTTWCPGWKAYQKELQTTGS